MTIADREHVPHALYRFFDDADCLLYIGITLDPGSRWKAHRDDKPWWHEVTRIAVEVHSSRKAVLEAERAAIVQEHPKHNIVHNRGTSAAPRPVPQLDRLDPIQVGDWAAFGLRDGRCPVGEITALSNLWVSVRLKEFLMGELTNQVVALRWSDVERVELAYPEDAYIEHGQRRMDDRHLGEFQTAWKRAHLPSGDPIENERLAYRRERAQELADRNERWFLR